MSDYGGGDDRDEEAPSYDELDDMDEDDIEAEGEGNNEDADHEHQLEGINLYNKF